MNIKKLLMIAFKELLVMVRDRPALLINFLAPLTLTFIIAAAFSGLTGGSSNSPIRNIGVLVVNQDKGSIFGNFGQQMAQTFLNPPDGLKDVISASEVGDAEAARASVRAGKAVAAVIIPPNFSETLNAADPKFGDQKVTVEVFRDAGSTIAADIVTSVVRGFVNSFTGGSIAASAAIQANPVLGLQAATIAQEVGQRSFAEPPVSVTNITPQANADGESSQPLSFNLLAYFAPAMAVFFLNFTMAFGAISILDEKANGTLQRMITSPTTRLTVLAGKFAGTFLNGVVQLVILIVATSLIAPLIGFNQPVWGNNLPGLALMILATVAASIGLGTIIPAVAKDRQQASFIASALLTVMGVLGGSFFASGGGPPLGIASMITVNYWATSGFTAITSGGSFPATNILVLFGLFIVLFGIGATLFSRKLDV